MGFAAQQAAREAAEHGGLAREAAAGDRREELGDLERPVGEDPLERVGQAGPRSPSAQRSTST
jgi:hypothetical protein